ncbi:MAG: alcohol dehydrogenase catalytic domain-containing protein [Actinobacteria bacterium]|nr:alcohol dehydrogenase catalytic domain-containing protein [Actinomycetota bacterium]
MKAAFLSGPGIIEIGDCSRPKMGPEDLLIKIKRVCICGSDNHIYNNTEIAKSKVKLPFILGHECSGEVIEFGNEVKGFKKGDRVAVEPSSFCGKCPYCLTGRYNLCDNYGFLAAPPDTHGAFREIISHNYRNCYKLTENMTYKQGALVEPVSIVVQAFNISGFNINDDVLIHGAGPIGLMTLMLLKTMGAGNCLITDINDFKLKTAEKLGADFTLNPMRNRLNDIVSDITKGRFFPLIFDTVGIQKTLNDSIFLAGKNATIVIIGISDEKASFDIVDIISKMLVIKGTTDFVNCFPKAIRLISDKKINADAVVTDSYNFSDINEAFINMNKNGKTIKTVINFDNI